MPVSMTFTTLKQDVRDYIERGYTQASDPTVYDYIPRAIGQAERRIAREIKVLGFQKVVVSSFQTGVSVYAKPDRWRETISINYGAGNGSVYTVAVTAGGSGYWNPPDVTFSGGGSGTGAAATAILLNGSVTQIAVTDGGSSYSPAPSVVLTGSPGTGATATASVRSGNNRRYFVLPRSYEYMRQFWPDDTLTAAPRFYTDYDYSHWLILPPPPANYPYQVLYWELPALLDDTNTTNWLTTYAPNLLLYASLLEMAPFLKEDTRVPLWQQMYDRHLLALSGEDMRQIADRTQMRFET